MTQSPKPSDRRLFARHGGAAIEFALSLPILLMLTLGILDWSWYFLQIQPVMEAAQAGARAGARSPLNPPTGTLGPVAQARATATQVLAANLGGAVPGATTYSANLIDVGTTLNIVEVTVVMPFEPVAGFMPMPSTISATFRMKVQE